jgi:hypothetical protein
VDRRVRADKRSMKTALIATAALFTALPVLAQDAPKDVHGPRKLTPWMVACTDVPVTSRPDPYLFVTGIRAPDDRQIAGNGQEIDINRRPNDGLAVGQRYAVRRVQAPALFPGESADLTVRTAGFVTITMIDENNALANVDVACTAIVEGDYLDAYSEPPLPTTAAPSIEMLPDWDDRSKILTGTDGKAIFADGDLLTIERGTVHGVFGGQRFSIWRDLRTRMPLFYIADIVIVEPGQQTSKAVVVKAVDAIVISTDVAIPRRQKQP